MHQHTVSRPAGPIETSPASMAAASPVGVAQVERTAIAARRLPGALTETLFASIFIDQTPGQARPATVGEALLPGAAAR